MKILVTGVKGQLGHDVVKVLNERGVENKGVDIEDFDITDKQAVFDYILSYKPDAVIHCSAYTAVDKAEENAFLAKKVNADGPKNIAEACRELDIKMVYISTDYVFPGTGTKAFETDDEKGPLDVYGKTKLLGEEAVKQTLKKYFIVRISWVFGINGNNFVKTMRKLSKTHDVLTVVCDQVGSPTYTADLAPLLCDMVMTEKYGTYHATNEGYCSWDEFARTIFEYSGINVKVNSCTTEEYGAKAARPKNSRLSKKSLDDAGFKRLPMWQDALKRYIKELDETEKLN